MDIYWLPDPESDPLWPQIRALLEPAAQLGGIEPYEPCDQVWVLEEDSVIWAAGTTRLLQGDEAEARCIGGTRIKDWLDLWDATVSEWAKTSGCWRVTWRGRPGWARFADKYGWTVSGTDDAGRTLYSKEL